MRRAKMSELLRDSTWVDTPESRKTVRKIQKYGLTPREYECFLIAQRGHCAGCDSYTNDGSHLYIDHCHETGAVRGLLCHSCNIALGWSRDNPKTLRGLAAYLESVAPERANDA